MYLVHLLQGKGYPVTQVFEKQVKPINTLRFDEFLLAEERKVQHEAELDKQAMHEFSFRSDASYDPLVIGPALKRARPDNVPELTLNGLPEYVTTSEEEDGDGDADYDSAEN
mmetsp:Transcript_13096/g.16691  ORF Transcript_13096/g.16691 Transcript_13096/m.16691 type:complete len:112 (+) Transcript_13096:135-470(+)|eukprot:CAMPEP_0170456990 /NCGR_PEP_ID=MMETSP0123-20130129/4429_1 /TAXON_ID=182087 /ORGANISM="Favella ehrenbergii, Strain Fehren 1" /LENGTH=111 /DNA_ID=CAMNT_0010720629 /DNA_START=2075 /DNA_END=2410 /DNA_ORIENTATION=+